MNRQTEMQTGEEYGGGRREMTVKSLCEIWEASVRSSVKPSTYACYVTLIEKHIQAELGNMSAGKLTNRVILEFVRKKQRQGLSAGTVRLLLFLLKRIVQAGKERGIWPAEELTRLRQLSGVKKCPYLSVSWSLCISICRQNLFC